MRYRTLIHKTRGASAFDISLSFPVGSLNAGSRGVELKGGLGRLPFLFLTPHRPRLLLYLVPTPVPEGRDRLNDHLDSVRVKIIDT